MEPPWRSGGDRTNIATGPNGVQVGSGQLWSVARADAEHTVDEKEISG
jgi:hypothetical protein